MAHKGKVTLFTPDGEKIVWNVTAEPIMKNGCCTFMQEKDGKPTPIRIMGTVVAEVYDTREESPSER